jgi:hypothetical protein
VLCLSDDEFSDTSTNDEIKSYLIKEFNCYNRKDFIDFNMVIMKKTKNLIQETMMH